MGEAKQIEEKDVFAVRGVVIGNGSRHEVSLRLDDSRVGKSLTNFVPDWQHVRCHDAENASPNIGAKRRTVAAASTANAINKLEMLGSNPASVET